MSWPQPPPQSHTATASHSHTHLLTHSNNDCRGLFHELGHNHQNGPFEAMVVSDSVVEVTCNWFSLYIMVGAVQLAVLPFVLGS